MSPEDKKVIQELHTKLANAWEKLAQVEDELRDIDGFDDEWETISMMVGDLQDVMDDLAEHFQDEESEEDEE